MTTTRIQPRMSVNKLGEYLTAKPARRRAIVTDQKHPKEFKVTRYRQATDAIIDFLARGGNDVSVIWTAIGELQRKRTRTEFQEQDRVLNIEALESFLELLNSYSFEGIACTRISGPAGTLNMSGVSISVQPNLIIRCTNRKGGILLGEIKLCFSKTHPLDREAGEYVGTVLYEHAQLTMSDQGKIDPRYCMIIDVFAGKVHMAPRAYIARKRDMEAACVEIALHWSAA